jgi:enterochelin esterase-like enzyme
VTPSLLRLLEGNERVDGPAVDAFLAAHPSPIVEGSTVTFLFRGSADAVHLRHWVHGLPSSQPFRRLRGTDLWHLSLEVPPRSRFEYKIEIHERGRARLVRDPLNPLTAADPFGANSVCHGSGYEVPEWTRPDPAARPGSLEEIVVPPGAFPEERAVTVLLPARLKETRRYPLLVLHDGLDYLRFAGFRTVLENLTARHEAHDMIVALTQSPDRMREYAADPRQTRFLVDDLLPLLEARFPVSARPADRGLGGASLGAVASLHAAWQRQGTFGRLLLQSGSFAFTDIGREVKSPILEPVMEFVNALRDDPGRPADRVYLSCGVYEGPIYENRSLAPLLQRAGLEVRFTEARDGHNWENWRDRLREGLCWLFPGPLGLVYE